MRAMIAALVLQALTLACVAERTEGAAPPDAFRQRIRELIEQFRDEDYLVREAAYAGLERNMNPHTLSLLIQAHRHEKAKKEGEKDMEVVRLTDDLISMHTTAQVKALVASYSVRPDPLTEYTEQPWLWHEGLPAGFVPTPYLRHLGGYDGHQLSNHYLARPRARKAVGEKDYRNYREAAEDYFTEWLEACAFAHKHDFSALEKHLFEEQAKIRALHPGMIEADEKWRERDRVTYPDLRPKKKFEKPVMKRPGMGAGLRRVFELAPEESIAALRIHHGEEARTGRRPSAAPRRSHKQRVGGGR